MTDLVLVQQHCGEGHNVPTYVAARHCVCVCVLLLTRPCSLQRVSMTKVCTFFSQIILQNSLTVVGRGP